MNVGIIGANGRMGRLFTELLESIGCDVTPYDKDTDLSSLTKKEVIIITVPISSAPEVIQDLEDLVTPSQVVIDFSSVMNQSALALGELSCETACIHPLFGPEVVSLKNQNIIVVPVKKGEKLKEFLDLLREQQALVTYTSLHEHEKTMAVVQSLTHILNICFAKTIVSQDIDPDLLQRFSSALFRMNKSIIDRLLAQSSDMLTDIQIGNRFSKEIINEFSLSLEGFMMNISKHDDDAIAEEIESVMEGMKNYRNLGTLPARHVKKRKNTEAIGLLGPRGTFTDNACTIYLGKNDQPRLYFDSISEVISAVKEGRVQKGLIPIENSIHGTVSEALDKINILDLNITKAIIIPIQHCLAVHPEGTEVEIILSHPHALGQCSGFIEKEFPNARIINTQSTSEAFQQIRVQDMRNAAAIGPCKAASIYGLRMRYEDIQDESNNSTRFYVITKDKSKNNGSVTSLVLIPFHEEQGLLFTIMKAFNDADVNLTKIESRPMKEELGKYIFYIDCAGDINDDHIKKAIDDIEKVAKVKSLGSYGVIR